MSDPAPITASSSLLASPPRQWGALLVRAGLAIAVAATITLSIVCAAPPPPLPADAPPHRFSAGRALIHLRHLAARPRPVGSAHHAGARAYIETHMRALGWETEVHATTVAAAREPGKIDAATVHNVVARLPGRSSERAVLAVGHYDSVPSGPGASDNGAAVAAMLEAARALAAEPARAHDIVFLFSDAEEVGLLGARAFREQHPLAGRLAVVLNFEARGVGGPSRLFETGRPSGALIRLFARAVPYPSATSLASAIYRHLPNDTDFSVFREAGDSGLNFAYIGGAAYYHAALDDVTRLDRGSLQHHGEILLALARELGDADLDGLRARGGDAVYFDVAGTWLVHYPAAWAVPLALIATALFLAGVVLAARRRALRMRRVALAAPGLVAASIAAAVTTGGAWSALQATHDVYRAWTYWDTYDSAIYQAGFAALAIAVVCSVVALVLRWMSRAEIAAAGGCVTAVLALLTAWTLPGASYLFLIPLLLAALGVVCLEPHPLSLRAPGPAGALALLGLLAVPALLLLVPTVHAIGQAFTVQLAGVSAAGTALAAILLLPVLLVLTPKLFTLGAVPAGAGALALLALASATASFGPQHPKPNGLVYLEDADAGIAFWIAEAHTVDDWSTARVASGPVGPDVSSYLSGAGAPLAAGTTQPLSLPPPRVELVRDSVQHGERTLELRIASQRQSQLLEIRLPPSVRPLRWRVAGQSVTPATPSQGRLVQYWQPDPEGTHVALTVAGEAPVRLRIVDYVFGLPDGVPPRQPDMMTTPFGLGLSDANAVTRSVSF